MQINFLSPAEEASFSEMIHDKSELAELVGAFMLKLEVDTDYDEVMISFEDEDTIRIAIEDSPYIAVLSESEQSILLKHRGREDTEEVFDEDGIENVIDIIASRILTSESSEGNDYEDDYGFEYR